MADFYIKKNDEHPALDVALKNINDEPQPVPNGATVILYFRLVDARVDQTKLSKAMEVVDGPNGWVRAVWSVDELAVIDTGLYFAEVEVNKPGAMTQTFPNSGYFEIRVFEEI
jgi:hypothetical protein